MMLAAPASSMGTILLVTVDVRMPTNAKKADVPSALVWVGLAGLVLALVGVFLGFFAAARSFAPIAVLGFLLWWGAAEAVSVEEARSLR